VMPASGPTRLLLFVVNASPRSMLAIDNLHHAITELADRIFVLEIVNVYDDPERALAERVMVTPTLLAPASSQRLVGDLSELNQLRYFLQMLPAA